MLGLVLEGGGAKSSYEIGVCIALKELHIEIDEVVGTSIDVINGVMISNDCARRNRKGLCYVV